MSLTTQDTDLLILEYLTLDEIGRLAMCNKYFKELALKNANYMLMQKIYHTVHDYEMPHHTFMVLLAIRNDDQYLMKYLVDKYTRLLPEFKIDFKKIFIEILKTDSVQQIRCLSYIKTINAVGNRTYDDNDDADIDVKEHKIIPNINIFFRYNCPNILKYIGEEAVLKYFHISDITRYMINSPEMIEYVYKIYNMNERSLVNRIFHMCLETHISMNDKRISALEWCMLKITTRQLLINLYNNLGNRDNTIKNMIIYRVMTLKN